MTHAKVGVDWIRMYTEWREWREREGGMRGVVWLAVLLVLVAGWSDAQQGACTSQTVLSKNTRVTATMEVHVVGGGTVSRTFYPQVDKYSLLDSQTSCVAVVWGT